ncbi:MAG: Stk1 family PASTA domain-containing Ser/Thr kinase [Firmicutes bacterium]|nr:Stk1 family PASTA domain-containing Ser/Thr kinase [Bacillota bacterium]
MIGSRLGNRYTIEALIGSGGMAQVYRGYDEKLHRTVAVKVLRPEYANDPEFAERFLHEAQAVASFSNPHVVSVYDIGDDADARYMVMEFVEGRTLKELINEQGRLPIDQAVDIARQICAALAAAHEHGVVHRDVKPHNVLITKDGQAKVTDFGIAHSSTNATITQSGRVMGSVHYFSPEQARGGVVGPASDLYSLGIVLYEMLTGRTPFDGENAVTIALKQIQEQPIPPRQLRPEIPQAVENVVLQALEKEPRLRFESARQMGLALDRALSQPADIPAYQAAAVGDEPTRVIDAMRVPPAWEPPNHGGGGPDEPASSEPPHKKKRHVWWWMVPAIIVALLAGAWAGWTFFMPKDVQVPDVRNLPLAQAQAKLQSVGLDQIQTRQQASDQPSGVVIDQNPAPGMMVKANRVMQLTVSSGPQTIAMIDVIGETLAGARNSLQAQGIPIDDAHLKIVNSPSTEQPPGTVIDQDPAAGQQVVVGQTVVRLTVSQGPEQITVPDVRNLAADEAVKQLRDAGFDPVTSQTQSDTVPVGQVVSTSPEAGQQAGKGSQVTVFVSSGPAASTTPVQMQVKLIAPNDLNVPTRLVAEDATGLHTLYSGNVRGTQTVTVEITPSGTQPVPCTVYAFGKPVQRVNLDPTTVPTIDLRSLPASLLPKPPKPGKPGQQQKQVQQQNQQVQQQGP